MSKTLQDIPLYRRVLYVLVPLALLGASFEGVLRLADREQVMVRGDDPISVYRLYPHRHGVAYGPEYRVDVRTDGLGMRTCDQDLPAQARPAPRADVLVLGDSFAEGWGVACREIFPELLRARGFSLQNGGVHGGTASFYVLRLRELQVVVSPSVLLVQLFDNDLDDLDKFAPFVALGPEGRIKAALPPSLLLLPSGVVTRTLRELATFRIFKRAVDVARGRPAPIKYYRPHRVPDAAPLSHEKALVRFGRLRPLVDPRGEYNGQFAFYVPGAAQEPVWRNRLLAMERYLVQLVTEARERAPGIAVVFVYIPAKEVFAPGGILGRHVTPGRGGTSGGTNGPPLPLPLAELRAANPFWQLLDRVSGQYEVTLIDGQAVLAARAEDLYYPGDAHLNSAGHAVLADAIAPVLEAYKNKNSD